MARRRLTQAREPSGEGFDYDQGVAIPGGPRMPRPRQLYMLALAATQAPTLTGQCPAVSGMPSLDQMCLAFNITVKNALAEPLEWQDGTCTQGSLLAVDPQNESNLVPLPASGEVFIPAGRERRLFAWQNRLPGGQCLPGKEPSGSFRLHLHDQLPQATVTLFYRVHRQDPGHNVLSPPGWLAPTPLGTAGYWGWNISAPESAWGDLTGVSSMTYIVAGCGAPSVSRHGITLAPKATAERRPSEECAAVDCTTTFSNCCIAQAEYACDQLNQWVLETSPTDKDYEPSICTADGSWSNPKNGVCTSRCGLDPEDPFAEVIDGVHEERYTCHRGFELMGRGIPHSCPPKLSHCSHPQPGYKRHCGQTEQHWIVQGNESTGDVSKCPPNHGCCVSSCGPWPNGLNSKNTPSVDGRSTAYTCDLGFVMDDPAEVNGSRTMTCEWSEGDGGYSFSPQAAPACRCREGHGVTVHTGWDHKVVDASKLFLTCGGDTKAYKCIGGILTQTPDVDADVQYCCTGNLDLPVTDQGPCHQGLRRALAHWEVTCALVGMAAVSLLSMVWCCYRRKGSHSDKNELRAALIGGLQTGSDVGTTVSSGASTRTSWIDPRMSFASQMQARVERAADQRSRRDYNTQDSNTKRDSAASSQTVDSISSLGSQQLNFGSSRPASPSSAASSSRRITQFKGGTAPEMIPFETLKLLGKIGTGSSGVVFEGELKGTEVAVKRLNLILDSTSSEQFLAEVAMLTKVKHPNVVLFFGVSFDDRDCDCYLITEYCERGNLQDFLKMNANLVRSLKLKMSLDVARGMNFLHQSDIVHRDLKSANVLVTEGLRLKICDFGISRSVDGAHTDMTGNIGTIAWSAPEMLSGLQYTSAVDVFSFGILLWEIVMQKAPYEGITSVKIISSVIGGLRPMVPMPSDGDVYIAGVDALMESCWHADPKLRPDFDSIAGRLDGMLQAESGAE